MTREEAMIVLTKELKCNNLDECNLKCDECGVCVDPKDLMEAYEMAIRALTAIDSIDKALPKICTTEFEAYVYHKILTIDEGDDGYE